MSTNSKAYTSAYQKKHYVANRVQYIAKTQRWKEKRRKLIALLKQHPCTDCGREFPPCVMDWDHVRGTKKFNLSEAATTGKSMQAISEEIAKCDLVCANCHRVRTHSRRISSKAE